MLPTENDVKRTLNFAQARPSPGQLADWDGVVTTPSQRDLISASVEHNRLIKYDNQ